MICPCCKVEGSAEPENIDERFAFRHTELVTQWGHENYYECLRCGVVFRDRGYDPGIAWQKMEKPKAQ